jgi:predicted amidohydrolase YtcJ
LNPGKAANFTVLAENPYATDPDRLSEIEILGTVFEGRWFPSGQARIRST